MIFIFKYVFFRNDATILESVLLKGTAAYPVLSFGSKKKLSTLIFDMKSTFTTEFECSKRTLFMRNTHIRVKKINNKNVFLDKIVLLKKIRIFLIKNTSKHTIRIKSMTIDGVFCNNHGFKILDCKTFFLLPNQSKKVTIV